MPSNQAALILRHIRKLAAIGSDRIPDRELVRRFVSTRDEAAFAALVRRHGSMVLRVCQRVLRHAHDAEDVFQATFLVLSRKAASLQRQESVGNWLYGVAYRLALKARGQAARRFARPSRAAASPPDDPLAELTGRELIEVLDDELAQLPDKYRAPLVLCYLEGTARDEAAQQLGCSLSTLKRRLECGRERLRTRLTCRGLTLSAALPVLLLTEGTSQAAVSATLLGTTIMAARLFRFAPTAAATEISKQASRLAEEVLRAMWITKLKIAAALFLAVSLGAAGASVLTGRSLTEEQAAVRQEGAPKPVAQDMDRSESLELKPRRADHYGDPLPEEALARLGTIRFRPGSFVSSLAFAADGKKLVSHDRNGTVCIWDAATGRELRRFQAIASSNQRHGALSADGKWLAVPGTAEDDGRGPVPIRLWDCTTGQKVREFGNAPYVAVQISPDGKTLAALRHDAYVDLWDFHAGRLLRSWQTPRGPDVYLLSSANARFSADGKVLVVGNDLAKSVTVWEVATGRKLRKFTDVRAHNALAVSPDGAVVAVDETDYTAKVPAGGELPELRIRLLDVSTGKKLHELIAAVRNDGSPRSGPRWFDGAAFSPDGKRLAAGCGDGFVRVWDVATATELRRWPHRSTMPWTLGFSPDGRTLAIGGLALRLLDVASGKEFESPIGHQAMVYRLAFLPDGRTAVTMESGENTLHLWDLATGREQRRLEFTADKISLSAMAFHENTFIMAGRDRVIRTWDLTTGKEVHRLPIEYQGPNANPMVLVPSPDGKTLAVVFYEKPVVLLDGVSGKEVRRFEGRAWTFGAAFAPDGRTLVTWGGDALARVWDLSSGRELRQIPFVEAAVPDSPGPRPPPAPPGVGQAIYSATVSPDGRLLAFGSTNKFIVIHEVATGNVLRRLDNLPVGVQAMQFSPDSRLLAWNGQGDSTVRLIEGASGQERHRFMGHRGPIWRIAFSADGQRLLTGSNDTTALVWALPGKLNNASEPLTATSLDNHWSILAGPEAAKAYQSIRWLAASPTQTIPYLKSHLPPVEVVDEKRFARLFADLDSNQFSVREKASTELDRLGERLFRRFARCSRDNRPRKCGDVWRRSRRSGRKQ